MELLKTYKLDNILFKNYNITPINNVHLFASNILLIASFCDRIRQLKEEWCNLKNFNLAKEYSNIISNIIIINLISKIHEYKWKLSYLLDTKKDALETLLKVAKIQSTSSSNKIVGIYTTDKRMVLE